MNYYSTKIEKNKVLIGIPCFNEEKTLLSVITEAQKYGDVLVVDDGSTDGTHNIIVEAKIPATIHSKRLGYGASITDLFKSAKAEGYDVLVTLDSDGQHDPAEIPHFLKAVENADVVLGNRFLGEHNAPHYRQFGVKVLSKLNRQGDSQCGFRAYNCEAINIMAGRLHEKGMGASVEIIKIAQANNLRISEIPCSIKYGDEKHTKNPISHGFELILTFAWWTVWDRPSKTLLPFGLVLLSSSAIAGMQSLHLYAQFHEVVLSWAFLTGFLLIMALMVFNALVFIICFKNRKDTQ